MGERVERPSFRDSVVRSLEGREAGRAHDLKRELVEIMPDPLGTDQGEDRSGAKEDFIGRVEFSRMECDCDDCQTAENNRNFEYDDDRTRYQHFMRIQPLTEYDNPQNVFTLTVNNNFRSKWMLQIGHLQRIFGPLQDHGLDETADLEDFLADRVFQFRDITFTEDEDFEYPGIDKSVNLKRLGDQFAEGGNTPNSMLVPVREVTDSDELSDLGEEPEPEVDESVDL